MTALGLAVLTVVVASILAGYGPEDTLAALEGASDRVRCVVYHETGSTWDPNLVGRDGVIGPAQLHPRGLLRDFLARVPDGDPTNPYQVIPYMEWAMANGLANQWTPVRLGWC